MRIRNLVILTFVAAITACGGDPAEDVDELFAAFGGPGAPGAAVLVIKDGQKVLTKTYGLTDIATKDPVDSATNFRLASVTKQFTAMAILMLVDEGKLTLETTLGKLYPEANDYAKGITIQQILRHQSGLPDYEPLVPAEGEQAHDAAVLRLMLEEGYFEPGTEYRYSNSGYAVLAMIVEKLSGQSFAEFLDARIFTPLGMDGTVAYEKGISTVDNRAYGYAVTDAGVEFADQSAWSAVLGDGGVYSSLDDLYTRVNVVERPTRQGGRGISLVGHHEILLPLLENYGYGWRIDEYGGSIRQHHSGSTSGFRNFIMRLPEASLTVIVLTNRAEPDVREFAEKVADLYL